VKDVGECQIVLCIGRGFAPFPSKEALGRVERSTMRKKKERKAENAVARIELSAVF